MTVTSVRMSPVPTAAISVSRGRHRRRPTVRGVLGSVAIVAVGLVWALSLRPQSLAGPAGYVMVRGISMNPTYHTGDLVVTHPRETYGTGDIVAYRVPKGDVGEGIIVIHRIIGGDAHKGYVIQGDNNPDPDPWKPKHDDIIGRAWLVGPRVGSALAFLHSPLTLASLVTGIVVAYYVVQEDRSKPKRHRRPGVTLWRRRASPTPAPPPVPSP